MLVDCLIDCSLFVAECRDTNIHSYSVKLQQFLPALGCWLCWYRSVAFFWLAVVQLLWLWRLASTVSWL